MSEEAALSDFSLDYHLPGLLAAGTGANSHEEVPAQIPLLQRLSGPSHLQRLHKRFPLWPHSHPTLHVPPGQSVQAYGAQPPCSPQQGLFCLLEGSAGR